MSVIDRSRHQGRRFITGKAEHQALVTGALFKVVIAGTINALSDVIGLLVITDENGTSLVIDTVVRIVVPDAL